MEKERYCPRCGSRVRVKTRPLGSRNGFMACIRCGKCGLYQTRLGSTAKIARERVGTYWNRWEPKQKPPRSGHLKESVEE